jgi:hypothetical protein
VQPAPVNNNVSTESAAVEKVMADQAATRQKAQQDVASRVSSLQTQAQVNPPVVAPSGAALASPSVPSAAPGVSAKEQKLADLLRRYQADEISPLEYHTERAKIIAEP